MRLNLLPFHLGSYAQHRDGESYFNSRRGSVSLVPVVHKRSAMMSSEVDLSRFFGMAVLINCKDLPREPALARRFWKDTRFKKMTLSLLEIGPHQKENRCYLIKKGWNICCKRKLRWLVSMILFILKSKPPPKGFKNVTFATIWCYPMKFPSLSGLVNLGEMKRRDSFSLVSPQKWRPRVLPIRAVAIE